MFNLYDLQRRQNLELEKMKKQQQEERLKETTPVNNDDDSNVDEEPQAD